jgi:protein-tyrosine phosphatase
MRPDGGRDDLRRMTEPPPGTTIRVASVPNLRDVGGWPTRDGGRVRRGLAYRSVELDRLDLSDGAFLALGVRTVYDLRTEVERAAQPDTVPPGVAHVVADVVGDAAGAAPAQLLQLLADPARATALLGDGRATVFFERGYRAIVSLPSARGAYRRLFTDLADAERRPILFHCTTGKDRTGWAAAALLMLLGVPDELVMRDYMITNDALLPALRPTFDRFAAAGGDPALLRPVLGVREEYLETAVDEMRTRFGGIEGYFGALGIDEAIRERIRDAFVERT